MRVGRFSIPLWFLCILALTAVAPGAPEVVDILTGQPIEGARLEPVDPWLGAAGAPVYGLLHLLSGLPDSRLLAWVLWLFPTAFALLAVLRKRRGRPWWNGPRDILLVTGWLPWLVLAALPPIWLGWLPSEYRPAMLVGVPTAVYAPLLWIRLARAGAGNRLREWRRTSVEFVGCLGAFAALVATLTVSLPGANSTGMRIVPPPGYLAADFHAHSDESSDGRITVRDRVRFFADRNVLVSTVCEHNRFRTRDEVDEPIWVRHARSAREQGLDMLILPGEEFTTHALHLVIHGSRRNYHPSDYRTYGPGREKDDPPDFGYDWPRLLADVHQDGARVVVAHWGTLRHWVYVDWKRLIDQGVDGFEISWGPERFPDSLIQSWREAGMKLFTASDFHGWRKALYTWTLIPRELLLPEGGKLADLDPWEALDRIFASDELRYAAATTYAHSVPALLDPPLSVWRYFTGLTLLERLAWALYSVLAGGLLGRPRRPR